MGTYVLTLAQSEAKQSGCGQLPEDSARRERDADPQEANVLDRTGRVSRLMAKARRDNRTHIVSGGKTVWKTVTTVEVYCRWSNLSAMVGQKGPFTCQSRSSRPAYAGTRLEANPNLSKCLCSYQRTSIHLPWETGKPAWAVKGEGRGTVTVVVVGVASHQGARESLVQGEGSQVKSFRSM
jgi:hypothetical protein